MDPNRNPKRAFALQFGTPLGFHVVYYKHFEVYKFVI